MAFQPRSRHYAFRPAGLHPWHPPGARQQYRLNPFLRTGDIAGIKIGRCAGYEIRYLGKTTRCTKNSDKSRRQPRITRQTNTSTMIVKRCWHCFERRTASLMKTADQTMSNDSRRRSHSVVAVDLVPERMPFFRLTDRRLSCHPDVTLRGVNPDDEGRSTKRKTNLSGWFQSKFVVERRRIELPTFALRTRRSPS